MCGMCGRLLIKGEVALANLVYLLIHLEPLILLTGDNAAAKISIETMIVYEGLDPTLVSPAAISIT
jgi:hypothetical protein